MPLSRYSAGDMGLGEFPEQALRTSRCATQLRSRCATAPQIHLHKGALARSLPSEPGSLGRFVQQLRCYVFRSTQ